ncbi:MAG: GNAT family N-acetyltransferase [Hyphomicrobium sp.]|jgi:GNAT superfamily N-acetyltransferase
MSIESDVTIRPIAASDQAAWEELFRTYINFYEAKVPDDVIALTWRRLVGQEEGFWGAVAVDADDRPIGLAHALFHPSTWSPTTYCYLEDLIVDRNARRHGVGRALIKAVYEEADRRGATRTYWATRNDNNQARRLYDRVASLSPFVQYRR